MEGKLLLKAFEIEKSYNEKKLFKIDKLEIYDGDKIVLLGNNGAGKTTLLKILGQLEKPDKGYVNYYSDYTLGIFDSNTQETNINNYYYHGLFDVFSNAGISGGEQIKKELASSFARSAPLLFLDEPTTNLDIKTVELLIEEINKYNGAIVIVTHDRYFIEKITNKLWIIDNEELRVFPGKLSEWEVQKEREYDYELFEYNQYKREQKRIESEARIIRERGKTMLQKPKNMSSSEAILYKHTATIQQAHVEKRAKAMLSRLKTSETKERPKEQEFVKITIPQGQQIRSRTAIAVNNLSIMFDRLILDGISFEVLPQEKIVIVGDNGSGKTSLLKEILNNRDNVFISNQANVGFYSQHHDQLDDEKTILENILETSVYDQGIIRTLLNNLNLSQEDIFKKVNLLSSGERAKAELARLITGGYNVLLLDEPTNHFDLLTQKSLLEVLKVWDGTLVVVTHNKEYIDELGEKLIEIKDKKIIITQ